MGIIEVADNVITIVADSAERARDIDISRAERAKLRAEKRLKKPKISIRLIWNVVLKLLFNAPLTGLMSEIVYNIFKIRWRSCPHLIFVGRESKEESTDQIWYNSCMIQMIFNLSSHLLFIFLPITY